MGILTPHLIYNGVASYPLNGQLNPAVSTPFPSSQVVRARLSVVAFGVAQVDVMVISKTGVDLGTYGALIEAHDFHPHGFSPGQYANPAWGPGFSGMWISEQTVDFGVNAVMADTFDVYAYGASGSFNIGLVVWTSP